MSLRGANTGAVGRQREALLVAGRDDFGQEREVDRMPRRVAFRDQLGRVDPAGRIQRQPDRLRLVAQDEAQEFARAFHGVFHSKKKPWRQKITRVSSGRFPPCALSRDRSGPIRRRTPILRRSGWGMYSHRHSPRLFSTSMRLQAFSNAVATTNCDETRTALRRPALPLSYGPTRINKGSGGPDWIRTNDTDVVPSAFVASAMSCSHSSYWLSTTCTTMGVGRVRPPLPEAGLRPEAAVTRQGSP